MTKFKKLIFIFFYISISAIYAQPGDGHKSQYTFKETPYIDFKTDTTKFSKYAQEILLCGFKLSDSTYFQLNIPQGLDKIINDSISSVNQNHKRKEHLSVEDHVAIKFDFYAYGQKLATYTYTYNKEIYSQIPFKQTYAFNCMNGNIANPMLNALDTMVKILNPGTHQISVVASVLLEDNKNIHEIKIATGNMVLLMWAEFVTIWNQNHKNPISIVKDIGKVYRKLADSAMANIFGENGLKDYFKIKSFYQSKMNINHASFKDPEIVYHYIIDDVPFECKVEIVWSNLKFYTQVYFNGSRFDWYKIPYSCLSLLPYNQLIETVKEQFPDDSFNLYRKERIYFQYMTKSMIDNSTRKDKVFNKLNQDPGFEILDMSEAGNNWEQGFVYIAYIVNSDKSNCTYTFDAATGAYLWKTRHYAVPD